MWKFALEFLSYASFVGVLYVISYSNHNSDAFRQVKHLSRLLLNSENKTNNFPNIVAIDEYWNWLEETFINEIVVQNWYNGQRANDVQGYLSDQANRLVGWATIRQLRVKSDTCRVKAILRGIIPFCYGDYSASNEETRSFYPGWSTNGTRENVSSSVNNSFVYQTSEQLDSYFYIGRHAAYRSGGYVYEFRDSLDQLRKDLAELHQLGWIDRQTRAILIQMNLYNPGIQLFTSAAIIAEILPSSGVYPSSRIEPLDFAGFSSILEIVFALIYLIFIVYFMIMEIVSFIRLKKSYFYQFWSYIEVGIIACSWTGVGIHLWRRQEATRLARLFRISHGDRYINFQLFAYINDIFSFLLGFCCFFGTLKFLRLCRYNRRLSLLSNTLRRSRRELFSFSFMFAVIFIAFLLLFYLQFSSLVWSCSSLLHTAQMLFEMLILKFNTSDLTGAAPLLGPLYFTCFIIFVVFVCINMFVSIVNDNFRLVRADVHRVDEDNQDVFIYLFKKVQGWFDEGEETKVKEQPRVIHVTEMPPPIQRLSERLDRLMAYVERRHGDSSVRIAWNETSVSMLNWGVK